MDAEELKKITEICKIKLNEEEYEEFIKELDEIVSYFSKIEELEVKDEELYYVNEIYNLLRDDEKSEIEESEIEENKKNEKEEKTERIIGEFTSRKGRSLIVPKVKI